MIDTIVLTLSQDTFQINDSDRFTPSYFAKATKDGSARINFSAVHGMRSKQGPTKKELLDGIYKPRLTLTHRTSLRLSRPWAWQARPGAANIRNGVELILKIELSLPKLFYGNNFQELKGKDLLHLLQKLSSILNQMGVIVALEKLAKAPLEQKLAAGMGYTSNFSMEYA